MMQDIIQQEDVIVEHAYRHILEAGTSPSTRRAHRRDLEYFWAWVSARDDGVVRYPVSKNRQMLFLIDHEGYMPADVDQALQRAGKRRCSSVLSVRSLRRIVGSLSVAHDVRGVANPCRDAQIRLLLKKADRLQVTGAFQKAAITPDILEAMLMTCSDGLRGLRDAALLWVGFATGGRRRSELAALQVTDVVTVDQGYLLRIRRSKTDQSGHGIDVPLMDAGAKVLSRWLEESGITTGALFRGIHRTGRLSSGISGDTVCTIVKRRIRLIGLDERRYGAHSLRSGFLTTAARQGVVLQDAMSLSGHRSERIAQGYYRAGSVFLNPAAHLLSSKQISGDACRSLNRLGHD